VTGDTLHVTRHPSTPLRAGPSLDTRHMMRYVQARLLRGLPDDAEPTGSFRSNGAARWEHTRRVLATAQKIARTEGADYDVVTVAAIFHDVAKLDSEQDEHAVRGAEIARVYLTQAGFAADWIARVCQAIVNHPAALVFSADDRPLEDCVLRDADLLNETGALGILWTAMNAGRLGAASYAETRERIVRYDRQGAEQVAARMLTRAGREIEQQRLAFVDAFIAQMDEECGTDLEGS